MCMYLKGEKIIYSLVVSLICKMATLRLCLLNKPVFELTYLRLNTIFVVGQCGCFRIFNHHHPCEIVLTALKTKQLKRLYDPKFHL